MAIPTGCWPSGTLPTTSAGPKVWVVTAWCRSNTAMLAPAWRVTNANRSSGEIATSTAWSPKLLVSVPTTGSDLPCSASATLITAAPVLVAASSSNPSWVRARPFCAPLTVNVCTSLGDDPEPLLLSTATELPRATNENAPSDVVTTPNGWPPVVVSVLVTLVRFLAGATAVVQPGTARAATPSAASGAFPLPPEPPLRAANAPPIPPPTTRQAATISAAGDRHQGRPDTRERRGGAGTVAASGTPAGSPGTWRMVSVAGATGTPEPCRVGGLPGCGRARPRP